MPLLCISLLALLLLPLSLSCDSQKPPKGVSDDYMAFVQTLLNNTRERIASLLQNSSCLELKNKSQSCTSQNEDIVSILHTLNCEMKRVRLGEAERLTTLVHRSIQCHCPPKTTKAQDMALKRKRNATRQRRNDRKKTRRERKLCKAKAILSNMTKCYAMLNSILAS